MGFLTREQVRAASDMASEVFEVPEWGGSVTLRQMTAGEFARMGAEVQSMPPEKHMLYVLSRTVCGEDGVPIFGDAEGMDVLAGKSKDVVMRLYKAVERLNKFNEKADEDAEKN